MSTKMNKTAVAATAALVVSGAAVATEAVAAPEVQWTTVAAVQPAVQQAQTVQVADVQGEFAFNQAETTPVASIRAAFQKVATLCNAVVTASAAVDLPVSVGGDVPAPYTATIAEMAEQAGPTMQLMGCSCTANPVGGRAIANAEVSGVSVADMLALAGI